MNCSFLECEYFFHTQTRGQGESCTSQGENPIDSIRPLSWDMLPQTDNSIVEPTEQASVIAEHVVGPPQPPTPQFCPPPVMFEVISETSSDSTIITPNHPGIEEDAEIEGDTGRYILPWRSTRGVPHKRYSPKKTNSRSRYYVANLAKENLSEMTRAFAAALYKEEEFPRTVEEAMKIAHWKEAMLVEMKALMKNKTWEVCLKPEGTHTVGCRWVFTIKRRPDGSSSFLYSGEQRVATTPI